MTTKNVPRHCQGSPARQTNLWLRAIILGEHFKSKFFELCFVLFSCFRYSITHASCDLVFQYFLCEKLIGFIMENGTSHNTCRNTEMKILHFKISSCFYHDSIVFMTSWIKEFTIPGYFEKYFVSKNKFLQRKLLLLVIFFSLRMFISIFGFKASVTWHCIKIPLS